MANFDTAAVNNLVSAVESVSMATGLFRRVNFHEPKSAPGNGLTNAIWAQSIEPLGGASGLDVTSGYVVVTSRIYLNMLVKPEDDMDPALMSAATTLIGAYSADFTLGGTVRNIDLLGEYGQSLRADAGYLQLNDGMYRIYSITIPCIVNDMWAQISGSA